MNCTWLNMGFLYPSCVCWRPGSSGVFIRLCAPPCAPFEAATPLAALAGPRLLLLLPLCWRRCPVRSAAPVSGVGIGRPPGSAEECREGCQARAWEGGAACCRLCRSAGWLGMAALGTCCRSARLVADSSLGALWPPCSLWGASAAVLKDLSLTLGAVTEDRSLWSLRSLMPVNERSRPLPDCWGSRFTTLEGLCRAWASLRLRPGVGWPSALSRSGFLRR